MPPRQRRALTLTDHLRGMGLSPAQIAKVPPRHRRALVAHMRGGNAFTSFFTKTLRNGFSDMGHKIKDAFTKPVNLPSGVKNFLNVFRDKINPGIASVFQKIGDAGIPIASPIISGFNKVVTDPYLKLMPPNPQGGRRAGARRAGARRGGVVGHKPTRGMMNIQGGRRAGALRTCSLCGSEGATAATCPRNPAALHRRHSRHPLAKMV